MAARAQIDHEWMARGATPPDNPPVVGLEATSRAQAPQALRRLRTETPRSEFAMIMASPAWRIPEGAEVYCYRLHAQVITDEAPVGPTTDLDALDAAQAAQAIAALSDPGLIIIGDHPGTRPAAIELDMCLARPQWCSRPAGVGPDGPTDRLIPLAAPWITTYQEALDYYIDELAIPMGEPRWEDDEEPDITIWRCLAAQARTALIDEDAHIDPADLARALAREITAITT
ncbi:MULTISPECIES: hypothetical protein [Actinomyces]|uniref:Uncharacterized protein n=1 Tax=Actinomyces marmotae TaxID=2737173 RepID=A0A6M8B7M1_9ACTO|nr:MULTISPECIES: hypothetical protein [Actinomyces]QKD79431.1 hypothetical protein HPC72_03450 [Actinomyces marmotae]